jgi:hypothetical protein
MPIIVVLGVILAVYSMFRTAEDRNKYTVKWNKYAARWKFVVIFIVSPVFLVCLPVKLERVKMNNGVIRMSGLYGGNFMVSDIQSVDTAGFYPKASKIFGMQGFGLMIGDFKLKNEEEKAKFNIKMNCPPFISIRMKDNSLFILNFKTRDETVRFYNTLKDELEDY